MREEDMIREEEKLNNSSIAENPEGLDDLSAATLNRLDLELAAEHNGFGRRFDFFIEEKSEKKNELDEEYDSDEDYESDDEYVLDEDYDLDEEYDSDDEYEPYGEFDSDEDYESEEDDYDSDDEYDIDDDYNTDDEYDTGDVYGADDEYDEDDEFVSDDDSETDQEYDSDEDYEAKKILKRIRAQEQAEKDKAEAEYLREKALKKRARKLRARERRLEWRAKRLEAFWEFVERRRKQLRWLIVGFLVLVVALITSVIAKNWKYHSLDELVASEKEDTLSVSYENINGKVLKYGVDSAMLVDHNNDMLWTISYEMNSPKVALRGDVFAIYDSKGTSVCICDETGQIGEVSTDMPIIKAEVAKQGVVAAILEDGQNAWIKNYKKDGTEIATLKTTFTNPGYPMDLGLSEDGTLMAINYLYLDNGTPVSRVDFYNFGTVGQNQKDNLVAETEYRDKILPEVEYLDDKTCVVFREDGFSIYTGSQIPMESVKVDVGQSIVSTFFDSEYIGLVMQNKDSENDYLICLYNKKGKEVLRKETDFHYQSVELNGDQIVLSSKDEFCVYSLQGVEKYRGDLEVPAKVFLGFGRNKFIYVSEDTFRIVKIG